MEVNPAQTVKISSLNLRNKGLKTTGGKLMKGCVKDAYTKLAIGTISSNYEAIIYHHNHQKGFGSSQARFYATPTTKHTKESNHEDQEESKVEMTHPSHSKKGYGPLIARKQRDCLPQFNTETRYLPQPQSLANLSQNDENSPPRSPPAKYHHPRPFKKPYHHKEKST